MLAGKIRKRLTPHNIHIINRLNGIILIGFGIALIWGLLFLQSTNPDFFNKADQKHY